LTCSSPSCGGQLHSCVQFCIVCLCLQVLATDPNFIRLAKGAYSLHCFHPDKEQLVRAPQPKEPKEPKAAAGGEAGATPAAGSSKGAAGAVGSTAKKEKEKEAVPMVRVEAKPLEVSIVLQPTPFL
jgi:hypothetical protein